jgi:hypothetical protein
MIYIRVKDFFDGRDFQIDATDIEMAKDWLFRITKRHFKDASSRMYSPLQIEAWSEYE